MSAGADRAAPSPREIELASLRAWPAPETDVLDGWELRYAAGFTKRANSVQPFGPSLGDLARKVSRCEAWYRARAAPAVFRMTPFSDPELEPFLEAQGYQVVDPTAVLHLHPPADAATVGAELDATELDDWLATYGKLSGLPDGPPAAMRAILATCREERLLGVLAGGSPPGRRACGMAVRDGALIGLFDLVTDPPHRRRGFGTAMIAGLLAWGRTRGARAAYLQVVRSNAPACALYQKLGFEHSYDYWYRIRPANA